MRSNPLDTIRTRRRSEEGFTLIELLVVVVILGILIGIAIPVYLNYRRSASDKAVQSDVRNAISTFEVCNSDAGYPTAVSSTGTLTGCASQTAGASISPGSTLTYVTTPTPATTGNVTSYLLFGTNKGGSKKVYCYDSTKGGGVQESTTAKTTDGITITAATACP